MAWEPLPARIHPSSGEVGRMVAILRKLFREANITGIEVVYTPPLP
jgi:hypothetical protein